MKRRFRGLRRPPREHYDVVVVGAGIGGLFSAALLAEAGLRTLLVEQHYMVGGYCSTFRRAGYTFDASSHFYPLLGDPTTLTGKILARLQVPTRWVAMDPVDTFFLPDGSRFEVPADEALYRQRLVRRFPAQRQALERFFSEVREAYLGGLLQLFRGRANARFERYRRLSLRQVLDRHFDDPALILVLCADCAHWGSPPERTSFVFDSMLRLSYFLGNYYPVGGSQAFADDLARRFEELGGEILTSTEATRIEVHGGRLVRAVHLETVRGPLRGSYRVAARAVVNNGDLRRCVERLAPDAFGVAERAVIERLRPTSPCHLVHLGLRGVDRERLKSIQGYHWSSWDPDEVGRGGLVCKVFVPTLYEPELAPPGGQIVMLQKVVDRNWDPGGERGDAEVSDRSRCIAEICIDQLRALLPELDDCLVTCHAASADTAARFTLNHGGAMLGWEMSPEQLAEARPDVRWGAEGLFHVGHWTRPGGGITPVIVSAQHAVDAVRQLLED
ncbi:MAG: NAD(P)/FAD-dependent oxidoreductase [Acidobacteria bacterium]|nr:MAG: NAD(P)/FAD-dependent oxidoreductase [Acidobacteriota bacterium]REK08673.1 MAG: NAD(P)/FAD-dependent oxidoreductase [Acidobacteriota bacterium]